MDFPKRLASLRKKRGLTQQVLADRVGVAILQIKRYEAGTAQPTLDAIRKLSVALSVSADALVFDAQEREPSESWRTHIEAVSRLPAQSQAVAREVIDALILKHEKVGPSRSSKARSKS
jgi:transcriptional regulator with XRE-family HTH domain